MGYPATYSDTYGAQMGKQSGLGDNFYVGGNDLSGDVSAIGQLGGGPALLDVTPLNSFANQRIGGLRDGDWQFTSFFEYTPAATAPGFPTTTTNLVSTYAYPVLVNITAGTISSVKVNGTQVGTTDGTYLLPALGTINVTYTGSPAWTWTAVTAEHSELSALPTADTIATYFRSATLQAPAASINCKQINYDPTRDTSGNLTLAVECQANGYGMEWGEQLTPGIRVDTAATVGSAITDAAATTFGAQAYIQLFNIIGTSVTIAITHATTSGGTYSTLMTSGALSSSSQAVRLSVSNTTTVDQYLKVTTSGTFTYASFAVAFMRNATAGQVF